MQTPTLLTERFALRPMTLEDWPDYAGLMRSVRARFMGGPMSREKAWGMFCHDAGQWALMGHGALMIEDRQTAECLGQVGLNHGPLFPEHELGWFVYERAEGKGVAYEAAAVMRDWAFEQLSLVTFVSYMDAGNIRSRRLAERLGGVLDADAARPDPGDQVYRYTRA
ncbi:GNAT family N-acetyltransferase [Roseibium sp. HPY-6]|uniref:GNAT family N-acetyltransferase n=1 Tax=Roseibium sp. HPY-6 TaxID=3229852 RepID=UPI00338E73B3